MREFVIEGVVEVVEEVVAVVEDEDVGGADEFPFSFSIFFLIFASFFSHPASHFSSFTVTVASSLSSPRLQVTLSNLLHPLAAFVNLLFTSLSVLELGKRGNENSTLGGG